jgi:hypothetical protein
MKTNNNMPWYILTWQLLWAVPTYAALFLFIILGAIMYGPSIAIEMGGANHRRP